MDHISRGESIRPENIYSTYQMQAREYDTRSSVYRSPVQAMQLISRQDRKVWTEDFQEILMKQKRTKHFH